MNDLEKYKKYIYLLSEKLTTLFEKEKPYICCKRGCAKCCKKAVFPYTFVEFLYLLEGFDKLDDEKKNIVRENVKKTISLKTNKDDTEFEYDCPFLIDDVCSVYENRGIICRSFGLIYFDQAKEGNKVPFCAWQGLNYSCVLDKESNRFSAEKIKELGYKEPVGYNIKYDFLISEEFERTFGFKFGEKKPLIDWFFDFNL